MAIDFRAESALASIRPRHPVWRGAVLLVVLLCGCGGPKHPPTYAVQGVVSVGGKPLPDATVSFIPSSGQSPANGRTDASGRFTLTTFAPGDGAMEGSYGVAIMKFEKIEAGSAVDVSDANYDPNAVSSPPRNLLSKKYASPQTSGLTATVVSGQENSFEFDLEK